MADTSPGRPSLGDLMRAGRAALSPPMTQEGLAKKVRYTTAMISKIEAGTRMPPPERVREIAAALGQGEEEFLAAAARPPAVGRNAGAIGEAMGLAKKNSARGTEIQRAIAELRQKVSAAGKAYDDEVGKCRTEVIEPFLILAKERVQNPPADAFTPPPPEGEPAEGRYADAFAQAQANTSGLLSSLLTTGLGGVGAGAAVGAATGFGLYTAVAGLASASTGTAIASLSGVAAQSATLAWLGGGALAAGGAGIAGGTMVLASAVVLPLAAVAGAVIVARGPRLLERQRAISARLDDAEDDLEENRKVLERFVSRTAALGYAFQFARARAAVSLATLESLQSSDGMTDFAALPPAAQAAFRSVAQIVTALLTLIALPIGLSMKSVDPTEGVPGIADDEPEVGGARSLLDGGTEEINLYVDRAISSAIGQFARV